MNGVSTKDGSRPILRILIRLGLIVALLVGLNIAGAWLLEWTSQALGPIDAKWGFPMMLVGLAAYVLLLSLPFVPGLEIGLALMMLFGAQGVVFVYLATVGALSLSFLVGRRIPAASVSWLLGWLHLHKARQAFARLSGLPPQQQLEFLVEGAPARLIPFLLRHRYLAIAIALNLPGNSLIGGGGGIGLLAGLSRIFTYPKYLLVVALATSPVPVLFLLKIRFLPF